jgi:hypothetical protein
MVTPLINGVHVTCPSVNNNLHGFSSYTATHRNYKINPSVRKRHKHFLPLQSTEGRKPICGTTWWELSEWKTSRQNRTTDVSVPVKCQKNCDSPSTTHIKPDADNHGNSIMCARDGSMVHRSEDINFITWAAERGPLWDLWRDADV